jgi:hypothetical protein
MTSLLLHNVHYGLCAQNLSSHVISALSSLFTLRIRRYYGYIAFGSEIQYLLSLQYFYPLHQYSLSLSFIFYYTFLLLVPY